MIGRRSWFGIGALAVVLGTLGWVALPRPLLPPGSLSSAPAPAAAYERWRTGSTAYERGDWNKARSQLTGLERSLPALSGRLSLKLAVARGEGRRWIADHPKSHLIPDALAGLVRRGDSQALDELLVRYPDHFRTRETVEKLLVRSPENLRLISHLVRVFPESTLAYAMALRWPKLAALSTTDWRAVAAVYGRVDAKQGLAAYAKADDSPVVLLERVRLLKRLKQSAAARALLARIPASSPFAVDAALERSTLVSPGTALAELAAVENRFPARGAELAWKRVLIVRDRLAGDRGQLYALYRRMVERYGRDDKAANAAWELAAEAAESGNLDTARRYARWLVANHPSDPFAPKAAFSLARWDERAGNTAGARSQFRALLSRWPTSYYAWRSAARLGLVSGEYNVENAPVTVEWERPPLPAPGASETFRALLAMGELGEAQDQWRSEIYRRPLTPAMQLADAQLKLRLGIHLGGINQSTLALLKAPPADPRLWEQAYPLLFAEPLREWSAKRTLNPLLVASLIRQESRFEPAIRSRSNAVGLMQLLPSTASWIAQKEPGAFELTRPADNVRLGTWYLRYTHEKFDGSTVLALASYNAGPGNVAKWLRTTPLADPEEFIENIPFKETRFYVVNIYENYWNYLRLYTAEGQRLNRKLATSGSTDKS